MSFETWDSHTLFNAEIPFCRINNAFQNHYIHNSILKTQNFFHHILDFSIPRSMLSSKLKTGGQILLIPLRDLRENPLRARIYYNDNRTDELVRSIALSGIVEPLTVSAADRGKYVIVSGGRRYRAALALGYSCVPCVLIDTDADELLFTGLSNQLTHDPLSFFEIAQSYEKLRDHFDLTYEETANRIGVSAAEMMAKIRLLQIPPKLRRIILEHGLSESYAKLLLKHSDEQKETLLNRIIQEHLSLSEARALSAQLLQDRPAQQGRIKTFFKDATVFINTIDRACAAMAEGGVNATVEKTEDETRVEYSIVISKTGGQMN